MEKIFPLRCRVEYSFLYYFLHHPHTLEGGFAWAVMGGKGERRAMYTQILCGVKLNGKVYSLLDFITQKRALKKGKTYT